MEPKIIETNADQAFAHGAGSKKRVINIQPLTRIEGHARISIQLDDEGNVADFRLNIMALRGFEKFIEGRPAEEVPRIVNRICGICPCMHHTPPPIRRWTAALGLRCRPRRTNCGN